MIHLDTSVLIDTLTGPRRSLPAPRHVVADGIRLGVCTLALYEWPRGPRTDAELALEVRPVEPAAIAVFGVTEARLDATLYARVSAYGLELDIAIAACAISQGAHLWTLTRDDFRDIPVHLP